MDRNILLAIRKKKKKNWNTFFSKLIGDCSLGISFTMKVLSEGLRER